MDKARIKFGGFYFEIIYESGYVGEFFRAFFQGVTLAVAADLHVKVSVLPATNRPNIMPGAKYAYSVQGSTFNFGPDLIKGAWDGKNNTCLLALDRSILNENEVWLLNLLMCRIFYSLSLKKRKTMAFIVHSSAVRKDGKVYGFFGPSGSGKSTIAFYSHQYEVLHDDMNLVYIVGGKPYVEGVPFNPKRLYFADDGGPLSMFFSLHKSDETKVEKGTRAEFANAVLTEIVMPLPLLSNDRVAASKYLLNCVDELVGRTPYYRLYFKKDGSFWDQINELEGNCE